MVQISVSERVAEKLTRMAERQHTSVDEILSDLLEVKPNGNEVPPDDDEADEQPGSGAMFLKYALAADIHAGDLAGNSREMLEKGFPRYLQNRLSESLKADDE
jgi:hypothetical protein